MAALNAIDKALLTDQEQADMAVLQQAGYPQPPAATALDTTSTNDGSCNAQERADMAVLQAAGYIKSPTGARS